jgi:hypothetical protein
MNGAESGSSGFEGIRYDELFVGSEEQYENQAKGENQKNNP